MRSAAGSEGIYFVVRQPDGWELIAFRFDEHPDGGHPEFWEAYVTAMLVKAWAPQLAGGKADAKRHRRELELKSELDLHYDGFPRGRVTWNEESKRFRIYHGDNLKPAMKVTRRAIEQAFEIAGRAEWVFDDHEQCSTFSAHGVRAALGLRERWKMVDVHFD